MAAYSAALRCAAVWWFSLMPHFLRCERAQHEINTSGVGSLPPLDRLQHFTLIHHCRR
jgi:hypothetical protein